MDRTPATTAVVEISTMLATFSLASNYPNPFNPSTTLHFSLPQRDEAELSIYNLLGQRVTTLVHAEGNPWPRYSDEVSLKDEIENGDPAR